MGVLADLLSVLLLNVRFMAVLYRVWVFHDDVIKWKYFPRYWPFVRGIQRSTVNSLHKGQWRGALMFSLICAWINGWVNNGEAGDLKRHRAHYDVIVMSTYIIVHNEGMTVGYGVMYLSRSLTDRSAHDMVWITDSFFCTKYTGKWLYGDGNLCISSYFSVTYICIYVCLHHMYRSLFRFASILTFLSAISTDTKHLLQDRAETGIFCKN